MNQPIVDAAEEYISDEELDATYVAPEDGEEESHNEEVLDVLANNLELKEENYIADDSVLDEQ